MSEACQNYKAFTGRKKPDMSEAHQSENDGPFDNHDGSERLNPSGILPRQHEAAI
jgi:hypothetical protein